MKPLFRAGLASIGCVALAASPAPLRSQGAQAPAGVTVTFLANEGVMLSAGGRKVLIDGLFLKYETGYAVPADSTQRALAQAAAPFDSVGLVLVTHRHGDHFHPAPVAAHLRANPRAALLTSQQVIDSLRSNLPARDRASAQVVSRTMAPGTRRRMVVNGIPVDLLGLPHGGRRHRQVEHLGYIVELGGRRVLHVGDADLGETALAALRLDTMRIDVALLPVWAVTDRESRQVIERWIRPRQVVAIHLGNDADAGDVREVAAAWPTAVAFVRSLDARTW